MAGSSPTEKRGMIQRLKQEAPVKTLYALFDWSRSTYYYEPVRRDEAD